MAGRLSNSARVGRALRTARAWKNVGQAEVAQTLGISLSMYRKWEHGSIPMPPTRVAAAGRAIGVDVARLAGRTTL